MGLEHAPIEELDILMLAELQHVWSSRFGERQVLPASPPSFGSGEHPPGFQLMMGNPPQKIWASDRERGLLLQSQADRLVLNWRKDFGAGDYPGFEMLRNEFADHWGSMNDFLVSHGVTRPTSILAEFTYVNTLLIPDDEGIDFPIELIRPPSNPLPGASQVTRFQFNRHVESDKNNPCESQISITGEPINGPDGKNLLLTVSAKSIVNHEESSEAEALEIAHALASHTFAAIISDSVSNEWERIN